MQLSQEAPRTDKIHRNMLMHVDAQPKLDEILIQLHGNLIAPKEQKPIDTAHKRSLSHTPPVAHGALLDLFVNSQESTDKFRLYLNAAKAGTRTNQKLKSIPDQSALYIFNDLLMDAFYSLPDELISEDQCLKPAPESAHKSTPPEHSGACAGEGTAADNNQKSEARCHEYVKDPRRALKMLLHGLEDLATVSRVDDNGRVTLPQKWQRWRQGAMMNRCARVSFLRSCPQAGGERSVLMGLLHQISIYLTISSWRQLRLGEKPS